ncbi:MAG: AbrB/MazE/SpoVT family DNA-binding domain-containing protein [Thermoanaerobaculia bacterium]
MPTATITSKGQITLPREVRDHLHLREGDRVEFEIGRDGEVRMRPMTGSVEELFGMLRRPGMPPRSLEEIDEGIATLARKDDERVRQAAPTRSPSTAS